MEVVVLPILHLKAKRRTHENEEDSEVQAKIPNFYIYADPSPEKKTICALTTNMHMDIPHENEYINN